MAEAWHTRPPRGALIVIAIGVIATIAAALLANEDLSGNAAKLEWVQAKKLPDSKPAAIPGGKGTMQLSGAAMHATGVNVSGYSLFSSAAALRIDAGSPVGGARVQCTMRAPHGAEVGQTPACAPPTRAPANS